LKINSIVIVNLISPKQSFFGKLLELTPAGVTIRGLDLDSFEAWTDNISAREENGVQPTTAFFPLHRVDKMILDEGIGAIPSLSAMFLTKVGTRVEDSLE